MKIKTSEATGIVLNYLVAKAQKSPTLPYSYKNGNELHYHDPADYRGVYRFDTDWSQGGPIIEREEICLGIDSDDGGKEWEAQPAWYGKKRFGPTPLIAAMRCFVASKLGEEVDVPDELCKA